MRERLDPMTLSRVLKHYKRIEVQNEIVKAATNKEAVGSYGGKGYGRRPDVLVYPNDVMEQVKNGVTSFHVSEEIWSNPQMISVDLKKGEYDALRTGWDLVLDIDCPQWEFAKIVTWLFVRALQDHGLNAITVKFSGNKGFHIGVPFQAFPERVYVGTQEMETKDMFPDGPRKIAAYLLDFIGRKHVTVSEDSVSFGGQFNYTIKELEEKTGKQDDELMQTLCTNCGKKVKLDSTRKIQFVCTQCNNRVEGNELEQYKMCPKCNVIMEKTLIDNTKKCCSKPNPVTSFNPLSIVEVDTVLIASRHLYRAPYSYHEKSGLVSIPIDPAKLLDFEKKQADPDGITFGSYEFLARDNVVAGEAKKLLVEAFDFVAHKDQRVQEIEDAENRERKYVKQEFEDLQMAIPEQFFPPCIQLISKGVKDGRKRVVFLMTNFLTSCGWEYDDIEDWFRKWNENNQEQLRDQYFLGQVRYAKQQKKKVLPPNCENNAYYKSFGVCKPDNFCRYIKNPANYAIKRARYAQRDAGKGKKGDAKTGSSEKKGSDGENKGSEAPKHTSGSSDDVTSTATSK